MFKAKNILDNKIIKDIETCVYREPDKMEALYLLSQAHTKLKGSKIKFEDKLRFCEENKMEKLGSSDKTLLPIDYDIYDKLYKHTKNLDIIQYLGANKIHTPNFDGKISKPEGGMIDAAGNFSNIVDDSVLGLINSHIIESFRGIHINIYRLLLSAIDKMIKDIEDEIEVVIKA